jgi:hypothetical protein
MRGAAVAASAGALLLSPALSRPAEACGGFWCSLQTPVNQSAEQIIFVDHPDETVTAIVQINYVGPSEKFAWVIPIPGDPVIEVSSNTAFARLDQATMPQYQVERHVEGTCAPSPDFLSDSSCAVCAGAPSAMSAPGAAPPIMVVNQGSVGPYDYATIAVNPALDEPADAAIAWFMQEGYDLTGVDGDLLGPYLADGLNLLAFRLTKAAGVTAGSIRPVILTYESELPMIPIRPTAVAAQADMGIRVWVSGRNQAVPENYRSLVINEALIDWVGQSYQFFGGPAFPGAIGGGTLPQNYDDVVTEAANQAGGQGFVTELAGAVGEYAEALLSATDEENLDMLEAATYPDGIDAIWAANNYYRDWDGWREAIEASVTLPAGTDISEFASNPDGFRGIAEVDVAGFFEELRTNVVGPVVKTKELLASQPYLTRMYSTMSAEEMTVDPAFNYNSDLADVSRTHVAQQFIECSSEISEYDAPWRIELPQGGVIRGEGSIWPIALDALPANLKVVQLSGSGSGDVVEDNSGEIGATLFVQSEGMTPSGMAIPEPPTDGMMIGGDQVVNVDEDMVAMLGGTDPDASSAGDGGCAVTSVRSRGAGGARGALLFGLAAVVTALLGRRRRAR